MDAPILGCSHFAATHARSDVLGTVLPGLRSGGTVAGMDGVVLAGSLQVFAAKFFTVPSPRLGGLGAGIRGVTKSVFLVGVGSGDDLNKDRLLYVQFGGLLRETQESYIFALPVNDFERGGQAVLDGVFGIVDRQIALLGGTIDLSIHKYDGDDAIYPIDGYVSYVHHVDYVFPVLVNQNEFQSKAGLLSSFSLLELNKRVLY
jgi:hypothetical protein